MRKTILITGATDGIGLETARMLVAQGHNVLLHGRNPAKLDKITKELTALPGAGQVEGYLADLSNIAEVETFAQAVTERLSHLDVLINNAGIFKVADPVTADGLDVRFAVNTLAPYLLTRKLLPLLGTKMVKEGFGMAGKDVRIGADILVRAALSEEFATAHGQYFDNDSGRFAPPHADALDSVKCDEIVSVIEAIFAEITQTDNNHP